MKVRIYPYVSRMPLPLRGVIEATVTNGNQAVRTKFHIVQGDTGTLLASRTSETLKLVRFARQVHDVRRKAGMGRSS